ncbi:secE, partial [Symbiodinium microadriaticum]
MSKEKTVGSPSLLNEMVQANRYKRTQGRIARQATLISIWVLIAIAAYQLYQQMEAMATMVQYQLHLLVPIALVVVGFWVAYRLINWPTFADFLIAVEAEMNKVTWPSKAELWRSVIVVIALIFILAMLLFAFDLLWITLFKTIGLIPPDPESGIPADAENTAGEAATPEAAADDAASVEEPESADEENASGEAAEDQPESDDVAPAEESVEEAEPAESKPAPAASGKKRGPIEEISDEEEEAAEAADKEWYILKVQSNREKSISNNLIRRVKM